MKNDKSPTFDNLLEIDKYYYDGGKIYRDIVRYPSNTFFNTKNQVICGPTTDGLIIAVEIYD